MSLLNVLFLFFSNIIMYAFYSYNHPCNQYWVREWKSLWRDWEELEGDFGNRVPSQISRQMKTSCLIFPLIPYGRRIRYFSINYPQLFLPLSLKFLGWESRMNGNCERARLACPGVPYREKRRILCVPDLKTHATAIWGVEGVRRAVSGTDVW